MNFDFAAARSLYRRRRHPRLLFGPDDLPRLRGLVGRGDGRLIYRTFLERTLPAIDDINKPADDGDLAAAIGQARTPSFEGTIGRIADLAFVAALDDRDDAFSAVRRLLRVAPRLEGGEAQPRLRLGCNAGLTLALAFDLIAERLTPAERRTIAAWFYRRGVVATLAATQPTYLLHAGANIPMWMLLNAVATLLAIEGEPGAAAAGRHWPDVRRMLLATLSTAVGRDGYPAEDTGYGTGMMARLTLVGEMLRRAGQLDPWTVSPGYSRFAEAVLHLVQPWGGHLTTTGDHGDDFGQRAFPLMRHAQFHNQPAFIWLAGTLCYPTFSPPADVPLRPGVQAECSILSLLFADQYRRARHPRRGRLPTAYHDRDRGIAAFRSDWTDQATSLFFDGSQRQHGAQGHEHANAGHFCLSARGEQFAVGPGRYNMEQSCHSVVLINGVSGRSTERQWKMVTHHGTMTEVRPGGFVDTAKVDSSHQHNCFWAYRRAGLVKGRHAPAYVWLVDDLNACNAWAEYQWQLHTRPGNRIRCKRRGATITGERQGNHLDIHFVIPGNHAYPQPHTLRVTQDEALPSSLNYVSAADCRQRAADCARPSDQVHYATFVRPRLLATVAGWNGRFATLLLPRGRVEPAARVTPLPTAPGILAARIDFADYSDTLVWAFDHRLLMAGDIEGRGEWCVVRRKRAGGRIIAWAVEDGGRLAIDGREINAGCHPSKSK